MAFRSVEALKRLVFRSLSFVKELLQQKHRVVDSISNLFAWWGNFCFNHPRLVMLGSVVSFLVLSAGLLPPIPQWVDGAERLYTLPQSQARDDGALHAALFADVQSRKTVLILVPEEAEEASSPGSEDPSNCLSWEAIEWLARADAIVRGREIHPTTRKRLVVPASALESAASAAASEEASLSPSSSSSSSSQNSSPPDGLSLQTRTAAAAAARARAGRGFLTYEDICLRSALGGCAAESLLSFGLADYKAAGLMPGPPEVWLFDNLAFNAQQTAFIPEYYLGGFEAERCSRRLPRAVAEKLLSASVVKELNPPEALFVKGELRCIREAKALMLHYDLDGDPQNELVNLLWEQQLIQLFKEAPRLGPFRIYFQSFRSRDDELKASTGESKDVVYVVFTFCLLALYSCGLNFSCDLYKSKLLSAMAGFAAAFMGLGAGMGLASFCGVAIVPTVLICPFLVLGIGVDDVFVLMNAFNMGYACTDPQRRCRDALKGSGLGITITTLTNLISFGVGAFSPYLSISNFCVYSALALLLGYLYVLGLFVPALCIDAKREAANRVLPWGLPSAQELRTQLQEHHRSLAPQERKVALLLESLSQEELVAYKVQLLLELKRKVRETRKVMQRTLPPEAKRRGLFRRALYHFACILED